MTLENDALVFRFPEVHGSAELRLQFQRTLRIPDDERDYPLPPGLGRFPLRHVDDFAARLPASWLRRGGVLLPMWQAEATWLSFSTEYDPERETEYPLAVKIAAGKRSAVTGEAWHEGLHGDPQDYLVAPLQPWLDGFCVRKGHVKQFVAMRLGDGYTVEEQLTGAADVGGLQIEVFPMRREVYERRFPKAPPRSSRRWTGAEAAVCMSAPCCVPASPAMGLGAGGSMRQEIYEDRYGLCDWDLGQRARCFVHLCDSAAWPTLTGETPPTRPPSARDYSQAGLPWFAWYGAGKPLKGGKMLKKIKSVLEIGAQKGEKPLPENDSAVPQVTLGLQPRQGDAVRVGEF